MQGEEAVTTNSIALEQSDDEEQKLLTVQVTAELDVPIDSMFFDADKGEFRAGDVKKDLVGECIAIKSGVYENVVWGNITAVAVEKAVAVTE